MNLRIVEQNYWRSVNYLCNPCSRTYFPSYTKLRELGQILIHPILKS